MEDLSQEQPLVKMETDEQVDKMIAEWDIVNCYICGREISMLNASTIKNGQYFVCKDGH